MERKLSAAIIGQGRSGRDIHGKYLLTEDAKKLYNVVAVVEQNEARRNRAKEEFGCPVFEDYRQLFDLNNIDVVINSTFSYLHFPITMDLLRHKLNVIVEKPFSKYAMECEQMIKAAKENGVFLTVFQQSRFAPYYERVKEIIAGGRLGTIHEIAISFSGFSRRWDWQCSHRFYGGALLNTGPHPMDQALDLLDTDEMPAVFSCLKNINSAGDAEDYAKVILTCPGRPLIEVEINPADAYSDFIYKVCGSRGSLRATQKNIKWKYFDPTPLPPLTLTPLTGGDGISPAYCSESLTWHEFEEEVGGTAFDFGTAKFYENVHSHFTLGTPLAIRPEKILQQIRIAELIHAQNPAETRF